jgi:hypothetical protein
MILFTEGLIRTESEGKSELWQWWAQRCSAQVLGEAAAVQDDLRGKRE